MRLTMLGKMYSDVKDFRTTFKLPMNNNLIGNLQQHKSLLAEEFEELACASTPNDIADALVDIAYIAIGMNLEYQSKTDATKMIVDMVRDVAKRLGIDFAACWDEVHSSNMSKVASCQHEVLDTITSYSEIGVKVHAEDKIIKSSIDQTVEGKHYPKNKVLKTLTYKRAKFTNEMLGI